MTDTKPDTIELSRIAFKAPPIWKQDVGLWFLQVELSFRTAGITQSETKFHHIVASLDLDVLSCARDLVQSPPAVDPYSALKERICQQFAQSENSRIRALLESSELGDLRPSQLLERMKNLADGKVPDEFLKTLWMRRLPLSIQQILSISKDTLSDLAHIADKINEVSGMVPQVTAVSSEEQTLHDMRNRISVLESSVARLKWQKGQKERGGRSRSRSATQESNGRKHKYCWYHFKFKEKASKCVKPCDFSLNK